MKDVPKDFGCGPDGDSLRCPPLEVITVSLPTAERGASPRHLIAIDTDALAADADYGRLCDRIAGIRQETLLVYVGEWQIPQLPDPDYLVSGNGSTITRLPGRDEVSRWDGTGVEEAVRFLADELLVHHSEVYLVIGADRSPNGTIDHLVVVGGSEPPSHGTWVPQPTAGLLVAALVDQQLFDRPTPAAPDITSVAFEKAVEALHRNISDLGFTAASLGDNPLGVQDANYAAVWARDGVITGLWTLGLEDPVLTATFKQTLRTLATRQTASGQIPSNVRLDGQPDYSGIGGIASIDSVLWYVIGAVRYVFATDDRAFAEELTESVERAMNWLAAHDANNDGMIEIPESSDWMDLFPRSYNVLYDEVLWYQACQDTAVLFAALGRDATNWADQAARVSSQIKEVFWPTGEQLMELAGSRSGRFTFGEAFYMLSQVTPFDYGWRCDVYANLLASLGGLLDPYRQERLFTFLWGVGVNSPYPVVCLYPPILSGAEDWKDYFLVNFLNLPDHYHNGGIWPFIGGLWVRFLCDLDRTELAHRELVRLAEACQEGIAGEWEFNEWLHGRTGRPMGKSFQAWSAASYVAAHLALFGDHPAETFPKLYPGDLT